MKNGVDKYNINCISILNFPLNLVEHYEFDLSAVDLSHPFVLSETEGGSAYSGATLNGNILTIDVTPSTPDLYYYCSAHYPSGNGMGNRFLLYHLVCLQT